MNFTGDLNGGDNITPDNDLIYKIYGDADGFVSPIATTGSHVTDSDVTVTAGAVEILNIDVGVETKFKITSVDAAGNESPQSAEFNTSFLIYGINLLATTDLLTVPIALVNGDTVELLMGSNNLGSTGVTDKYIFTNEKSTTGLEGFGLKFSETDLSKFFLFANNQESAEYDVSDGTLIKMVPEPTGVSLFVNGIFKEKISFAFVFTSTFLAVGAFRASDGVSGAQYKIKSMTIKGEFFDLEENTGTTSTGDNSTVATFVGSPVWYTI